MPIVPWPAGTDLAAGRPDWSRLHSLKRRLLAVCFGAGVDSTAMLVALHAAGIRPHIITFADVGAEKPETMAHLERMNAVLAAWGWPPIDICRKIPLASTGYDDLYGNCIANETLPSLAFGMASCSIKYKQIPQDQFIKGARRGPLPQFEHDGWPRPQLRLESLGEGQ